MLYSWEMFLQETQLLLFLSITVCLLEYGYIFSFLFSGGLFQDSVQLFNLRQSGCSHICPPPPTHTFFHANLR